MRLIILLALFVSCGKVETPSELFDFVDYNNNQSQLDKIGEDIATINNFINTQYTKLDTLESLINNQATNQDALSTSITNTMVTILELEQRSVSKLIDPCGDNPNKFDEVLVKLGDGTIFGYFEQGNKRYLTVLSDGNYRTTDAQRCHFAIINGTYQGQ